MYKKFYLKYCVICLVEREEGIKRLVFVVDVIMVGNAEAPVKHLFCSYCISAMLAAKLEFSENGFGCCSFLT